MTILYIKNQIILNSLYILYFLYKHRKICIIPSTPNIGYAEFIKFENPKFEVNTPTIHITIATTIRLFEKLLKKLFPNETEVVNIDNTMIAPYIT